jgi:Uma2 family endonuclease
MTSPAIAAIEPTFELIYDDGEPLESPWHRAQINLLIDVIEQAMARRGRRDFFAGGNMFVYFSVAQAQAVATLPVEETRQFRGPDVFFVGAVDRRPDRNAWVVWQEGGRYPDVIVELLSPSTAAIDRTEKKDLYERTFRTPEYFLYDRETDVLEGWQLVEGRYEPLAPDHRGWLLSRQLDLWLGRWQGERAGQTTTWLRLFNGAGRPVPTADEAERQHAEAERQRAEAEHQRAEAERQRAEAAEAEVARLRTRLAELGEG